MPRCGGGRLLDRHRGLPGDAVGGEGAHLGVHEGQQRVAAVGARDQVDREPGRGVRRRDVALPGVEVGVGGQRGGAGARRDQVEDVAGDLPAGQVAAGVGHVVGEPLAHPQRPLPGAERADGDVGHLVGEHDVRADVAQPGEPGRVDDDPVRRRAAGLPHLAGGDRGDLVEPGLVGTVEQRGHLPLVGRHQHHGRARPLGRPTPRRRRARRRRTARRGPPAARCHRCRGPASARRAPPSPGRGPTGRRSCRRPRRRPRASPRRGGRRSR